ncbi:ammosamide/lymphostin RiPP family protein [Sphaerisporangium aureirubrum]|uniref:Ammosamide/lymphostin RiPP family protein n=1 Tax=Sphaerisporangium aureirubrum TaxID=1544736 RepID=A0ABW1NGE1_9ACTN
MADDEITTDSAVDSVAEDGAYDDDELGDLDDMEFLLEEIENRIAPLA